jgi:integrase|tara:strand:+ start:1496 stop:3079 length:1584 start_codon:yes stop_codon:yes gene_type:complete
MISNNTVFDIGFTNFKAEPLTIEERTFTSRLGYKVELLDESGEFNSSVKLADDTSGVSYLYFDGFSSLESELKEHLKNFYIYLLPRYLPGTMRHYHDAIKLVISAVGEGEILEGAIEIAMNVNPAMNVNVMKSFAQFLILNEYEGLSYDKAEEILMLEGYSVNTNGYLNLFTLDDEMGPFTREELRILNEVTKNTEIEVADRLLLTLCLQFGLRRIQISLLKESDFIEDETLGVCYLNVPRVKQGAQFRRTEFSKRFVDDELSTLIKSVLKDNFKKYGKLGLSSPPLFYRKRSQVNNLEKFPQPKNLDKYSEVEKIHYAHHISPSVIGNRLSPLSKKLPLSPRTGKPFHLTPYRFRYTVGTNAVMEGMTEEEVADLLDHSSILCIKHYFRYTREMWELLENATANRTEQQHFTAAWNREDDLSGNIYGKEIIELHAFTAIGKCQKEAACYLEPAVACYNCDKFCPNKETNSHKNALTSLKDRKEVVASKSTDSLSKHLDEAIAGCEAAIAYSEGVEVVNIYQGGRDE